MTDADGFYKTGAIIDPAPVLLKATQIAQSSKALTAFEANFLKETLHACVRFSKTFHMSDKQATVLDRMWTKHYLPTLIDAKVVKETK